MYCSLYQQIKKVSGKMVISGEFIPVDMNKDDDKALCDMEM